MTRPNFRLRTLVAAGVVAMAGAATLSGQPERPAADDMKALVAEVRALRVAVERTAAVTSQAQLLLGRVQLQENRLATLGRQYQEARTRLVDAQATQAESEQRLQYITGRVREVDDPQERRAMEDQLASMKREVGKNQARTAQMQADETAALQALTTEQQRWSDFNDRLGALEQALGRSAAPPR
jgi:chromosome segregation ATPase